MKEMSAMKKIVIGILTLGLLFGIGGMTFADELADILHPVDPKRAANDDRYRAKRRDRRCR